jgi:hypothetical protein
MGADFIFWAVSLPKNQKPNWKAGERYIDKYEDVDARSSLRSRLKNFQLAWSNQHRESGFMTICHLEVLVSGGMSWGDTPTDLGNDINDLSDSGVLEACGFDLDDIDYKAILLKILNVKGIAPLLVGIDDTLDELVEKKLRKKR